MRGPYGDLPPRNRQLPPESPSKTGVTRRGVLTGLARAAEFVPAAAIAATGFWYLAKELEKRGETKEPAREQAPRRPSEAFLESVREQQNRNRGNRLRRSRSNGEQHIETHTDEGIPLRSEYASVEGEQRPTRIEYVHRHIGENLRVPETVKQELLLLIPAIPAQESHYDNSAESEDRAVGLFQFQKGRHRRRVVDGETEEYYENGTLEEMYNRIKDRLPYEDPQMRYLVTQVLAVGEYFSVAYEHLQRNAGDALATIQREFFGDNQEAFEREFLTPVLIDTYHAGRGTMTSVLHWFVETYPTQDALARIAGTHPHGYGFDVFHFMTEAAKTEGRRRYRARRARGTARPRGDYLDYYGEESEAYVEGVYSYANLFIQHGVFRNPNRQ